jgi:parallel beta-helix repeat protein
MDIILNSKINKVKSELSNMAKQLKSIYVTDYTTLTNGKYVIDHVTLNTKLNSNMRLIFADGIFVFSQAISIANKDNISIEFNNAKVELVTGYSADTILNFNTCKNIVIMDANIDGINKTSIPLLGIITLVNCTNSKILNNTITNVKSGLYYENCTETIIKGNVIEKTTSPTDANSTQIRGIKGVASIGNIITENVIKEYDIGIEIFLGCNDSIVSNNIITSPWGISIDQSERVTVIGNNIFSSALTTTFSYGIELAQAKFTTVSGNSIYILDSCTLGGGYGIAITGSGANGIPSKNCNITGNTFYGSKMGINIAYAVNIDISSNTFDNCKNTGCYCAQNDVVMQSNNIKIIDNSFYANVSVVGNGIYFAISNIKDVQILNNRIQGFEKGISLENSIDGSNLTVNPMTQIFIENNQIITCSLSAIDLYKITDCYIKNNYIKDIQKDAIMIYSPYNTGSSLICKDNYITNSCISASGGAGIHITDLRSTWNLMLEENTILLTKNSKPATLIEGATEASLINVIRNNYDSLTSRQSIFYGTIAPTVGMYYRKGDICYNTSPSASGYMGWICITAGWTGTWKGFGLIQA